MTLEVGRAQHPLITSHLNDTQALLGELVARRGEGRTPRALAELELGEQWRELGADRDFTFVENLLTGGHDDAPGREQRAWFGLGRIRRRVAQPLQPVGGVHRGASRKAVASSAMILVAWSSGFTCSVMFASPIRAITKS